MNNVTIAVVLDGIDLTDKQWAVLEPIFRPRRRADGRGRPWTDPRGVMNAVLWILRTGAPWVLFRLNGSDDAIDVTAGKEFRAWRWMPFDRLVETVAAFRKPVYRRLANHFRPYLG